MRQTFVILFSFLLLSAVRAFPFGAFLVQERHVVTESRQIEGRQLLDALSSIGADISSAFSPPETTSSRSVSAATRTPSSDDDDDEETTTSSRSTATRTTSTRETTSTPTRTSTRTSSSEASTETSTSDSSTSESSTSESSTATTASSTTSVPAETVAATETPEASKNDGGGPNVAAIAGGIAGGIVFLIILNVILFWGCGPLKKWRENRAYQRMMDRTYRPALDDPQPFFPETRENRLGLNPTNVAAVTAGGTAAAYRGINLTQPNSPAPAAVHQRAFSFSDDSTQQNIRRKPLPTIGTGGASPLIGAHTPTGTGHDRAEPWLPGGAR